MNAARESILREKNKYTSGRPKKGKATKKKPMTKLEQKKVEIEKEIEELMMSSKVRRYIELKKSLERIKHDIRIEGK